MHIMGSRRGIRYQVSGVSHELSTINHWLLASLFSLLASLLSLPSQAQLAPTPPMGWNSYNAYGSAVHEDEVKANADFMAKNLKKHGWNYIVVDFCWAYDNPPGSTVGNPYQYKLPDGSYVPWLSMDKYGRLLPDEKKFPSAKNGVGFKALADYVHSLGLKFGIHIMRGIPRQAAWAKTPVKGAQTDASAVADTSRPCPWLNHMWGVDMKKPGAQEYYNSIADLYASWDVDYIKMDDMNLDRGAMTYYGDEVEAMHKAIVQTKRPMVLSISPVQEYKNRESLVANANAYRVSLDFWDNWEQLKKQFSHCVEWAPVSGPGHWPDADMLQIGKVSKRGPVGKERFSRFTEAEQRTHITLWTIFRSPLMMGGNMPENTPFVNALMNNDEVLNVNQHSINSRQLYRKNETVVWVSQSTDKKTWNVALFNLNDEAKDIQVDLSTLGLKGKYRIRNLWQKVDEAPASKIFTRKIGPHDAALFTIKPIS